MRLATCVTAAVAVVLGGCNLLASVGGGGADKNDARAEAAGNDSDARGADQPPRRAEREEQPWIVGRWVNLRFDGSCEDPDTIIEYTRGGQVRYAGRHVADWELEGDRLTQSGGRGEPTSGRVDRDGDDRFRWNDTGPFVRCAGGGGGERSAGDGIRGSWRVRFTASGVVYSGEFEAAEDEGTLTLDYRVEGEERRVRQRCRIRAGREVEIRCRDPRILRGADEQYAPDNFFLNEVSGSTMRGTISSQPGETGTVIFRRD